MRSLSSVIVVVAISAGLIAAGQRAGEAAAIENLIRVLETPKTPDERPGTVGKMAWNRDRHRAWAGERLRAQKTLTGMGARAVGPLLMLVKRTKDDSVRITALTGLSSMTNPAHLSPTARTMIVLLDDENPAIRYLAAKVLGKMRYVKAVAKLNGLTGDKEDVVRMVVADALGRIRAPSSVGPLLKLLHYGAQKAVPPDKPDKKDNGDNEDEDEEAEDAPDRGMSEADESKKAVRLHAIAALGKVGVALPVVPEFLSKLASPDINEREATVDAIKELLGFDVRSAKDFAWTLAFTAEQRKEVIDHFAAWWKAALEKAKTAPAYHGPELALRIGILGNEKESRPMRLKAVEVIARMGNEKVPIDIVGIMLHRDKEVRKAVAKAASKLSGVKIEYLPEFREEEWFSLVNNYRERLRKRGKK